MNGARWRDRLQSGDQGRTGFPIAVHERKSWCGDANRAQLSIQYKRSASTD